MDNDTVRQVLSIARRLVTDAETASDLREENERLRGTLESIAHSSCCALCQEYALFAKAALRRIARQC